MNKNKRIQQDFFRRDIFEVGKDLIGKIIVRKRENQKQKYYRITELELYVGENDLACHASKGRTKRTEIMYAEGGHIYVYLIYGMYWMLNFVTGKKEQPQAILIRAVEDINGPGKVGCELALDKSFYGENIESSHRIWIEDDGKTHSFTKHPRINIDYAGDIWKNKAYRYCLSD